MCPVFSQWVKYDVRIYMMLLCSLGNPKEYDEHLHEKDSLDDPAEGCESNVKDAEEVEEGELDSEMQEWIEMHKKDVLDLHDGEHHLM